jgi:hypothetical protein
MFGGGACGTYGGEGEFRLGVLWGNLKERVHLEDLGLDEIMILKLILSMLLEGDLVQDKDNVRPLTTW